jgi:hypothetical protein
VQLNWNKTGTNKEIISELKDRLLFHTDDYSQADFEKILKYDFDPKTAGSENAVMRLFNYMIKTPEFQLIYYNYEQKTFFDTDRNRRFTSIA